MKKVIGIILTPLVFVVWAIMTIPVGLFGYLTGWLVVPFGLLLENVPFLKWVFWIWMDDSRFDTTREGGLAEDFEIWLEYKDPTFWTTYVWTAFRQNLWNAKTKLFFSTKKTEVLLINYIDKLFRNGKRIHDGGQYVEQARLKYIDKLGNDGWNVNRGEFISKKYSTTGISFRVFITGWIPSFRYSHCVKIWKYWNTVQMGTNRKRFVFNVKLQKAVKWR